MNSEAFKLARATLRLAIKDYGWSRTGRDGRGYAARYTAGPGKFEGEHWSIVHYYDAMLNGFAGDSLTTADGFTAVDFFEAPDAEREAFRLAHDTAYVALVYSESGFVSMQEFTVAEFERTCEEWERDNDPNAED